MKNILVLCDDFWHPGEVIEKGFSLLEGKDFHFVFVRDAKDILTPEYIREFPMVINCKSDAINGANNNSWFEQGVTEVMPQDFSDYVEEGHGFLSIHSGNAFRPEKCQAYTEFVGCSFVTHPPRCLVEVRVAAQHPITQGIETFTVRDEHYQIKIEAPDAQVLLTTHSSSGGDQVGGYVRKLGKGKICVLTPGHIYSVWQEPQFQKLVINSLCWCCE